MEKALNKMKIYRNINFTLVISHIIITIVILRLYVKYAYADFGMFMKENSTLIWIIYFLSILIVVIIMSYNKKQYQKEFMNEVANNICSKYITDIRIEKDYGFQKQYLDTLRILDAGSDYKPKAVLSGSINSLPIMIGEMLCQREIKMRDTTQKVVTFKGYLCETRINKNIPGEITINLKEPQDNNIFFSNISKQNNNSNEFIIENQLIKEKFRITTTNKEYCNTFFTPDVLGILLSFEKYMKYNYTILIQGNRFLIKVSNPSYIFNISILQSPKKSIEILEKNISMLSLLINNLRDKL